MITGAARIDVAILVVSCEEGPMAQTREHILLCKQVGVKGIVVYLNKAELVKDDEIFELLEMEIKDILDGYGYSGKDAKFVHGSAKFALQEKRPELGEESIAKLIHLLDTEIPIPEREIKKPFFFNVEHTLEVIGRGMILTGTIETGQVKPGELVEILGMGKVSKRATVVSIETFKKTLDHGEAGDNVGMLVRGLKKDEVCRGQCVTTPGYFKCLRNFDASIYVLKPEDGGRKIPFRSKFKPQCFIRTGDVPVALTLPEKVPLAMPGDKLKLKCKLEKPTPIAPGTKFAFREGSKTVAVGTIDAVYPDTEEDRKNSELRAQKQKKQSLAKPKAA